MQVREVPAWANFPSTDDWDLRGNKRRRDGRLPEEITESIAEENAIENGMSLVI